MKLKNIIENIVLAAIFLVIVQTFLSELAISNHWNVQYRLILIFSGLFFDLFFTIEFIIRSIISGRRKEVFHYWFYERGWVDFLSSAPLLLLDSGPTVFLLLSGGAQDASGIGILNVLKVVKAIRVTRILRLVRIIKIFGKIHNVESKMAQHHSSTITTTAVFTIVCSLIFFAVITGNSSAGLIAEREAYYKSMLKNISSYGKNPQKTPIRLVRKIFTNDKNLMRISRGEQLLVSNVVTEEFNKYYTDGDYISLKHNNLVILVSIADINKGIAIQNIQYFFIIVLVVLSFMFIYTRHFAQNISDLIHIMGKGFRKKNYNLQIKIKKEFADDEIYRLAKFYNEAYLPAKLKRLQEQDKAKNSGISMDDIKKF